MRKSIFLIISIAVVALIIKIVIPSNHPEKEIVAGDSDTSTPTQAESYLLPDLQVVFPEDLYIQINPQTKQKEIRFETTTVNLGKGPLVMVSSFDESENKTRVTQQLQKEDGNKDDKEIGTFIFHPGHNHWHFENFSEMELFSLNDDKSPDVQLKTTGKITSCIHDLYRLPSPPPGSPETGPYAQCGGLTQGISVGWADTYRADLPGQQLDIEGIEDGQYVLRLSVDPINLIMESDDGNNSVLGLVEIRGNTIERLPDSF